MSAANIQARFYNALHISQNCCLSAPTPKMPYLCVVGTLDFDEPKGAQRLLDTFEHYKSCVDLRLANEWCATNDLNESFEAFRERVEQEEFWRVQDYEKHAESEGLVASSASLDSRQLASQTETLEFCGCRCFRALSVERGFYFA